MIKQNEQESLFDKEEMQKVDGLNYKTYQTLDAFGRPYQKTIVVKTKKQALDEVQSNAENDWWYKTKEVIHKLAKENINFTSDEVWAELDRLNIPRPHQPSALGSVFRACCQAGWITKSGKYKPSTQPTNHQRDVAIWTSCFF